MNLHILTELDYWLENPTDVLLQLEAALMPEQAIESAHIDLPASEHFARLCGHNDIGDRIWMRLQGSLKVRYEATIAITRSASDVSGLPAVPPHLLPADTIEYLMPSRYCPSDQFELLVEAEYGNLAGGDRIAAFRDWIEGAFTYAPGSSSSATSALESYVARQGVCRDYAHLLVSLARASGIPARFASAYGLGVKPQDFHAVAEVFLDSAWHIIDATGMASAESIAIIGVGRDAADVSFLTSYGMATFNNQSVQVEAV